MCWMSDSADSREHWIENQEEHWEEASITDLQGCEIMKGQVYMKANGTILYACSTPPIPDPTEDVFLLVDDDHVRITGLKKRNHAPQELVNYIGRIVTDE